MNFFQRLSEISCKELRSMFPAHAYFIIIFNAVQVAAGQHKDDTSIHDQAGLELGTLRSRD